MRLRTAILALILAATALPLAQAQDRGRGEADRRTQMMFRNITLTPAQQARVDSILGHYRRQMGPMTPGQRPDSAGMVARRAHMQKQQADIRALLTPEQQAAFDRNLEEMRGMMQRRRDGGGGGR